MTTLTKSSAGHLIFLAVVTKRGEFDCVLGCEGVLIILHSLVFGLVLAIPACRVVFDNLLVLPCLRVLP